MKRKISIRKSSVVLYQIIIMEKFQPVLPHPIKWSSGINPFGDPEKTKQIQLQIPVDSIDKFCEHLQALKNAESRHRTANGWDYEQQQPKQVQCVYLRSNGRAGIGDSSFGTINPTRNSDLYKH